MKTLFTFFTVMLVNINLMALYSPRLSSAPFVSGDSFRMNADFIYDEAERSFNPEKVCKGDSIFVRTIYLEEFLLEVHPKIRQPYVLITHNSVIPSPGKFSRYLNDPKILAWFAQNNDGTRHPKLIPIPVGIANRYWPHGSINVMKKVSKHVNRSKRTLLLLATHYEKNHPDRTIIMDKIDSLPFCVKTPKMPFGPYLKKLTRAKFVISPRGNGLDCHRHWECLYMGAIPVIISSHLNPLFENLPVLIIHNWDQITPQFLEKKYKEISSKKYNLESLYFDYWLAKIKSYKCPSKV